MSSGPFKIILQALERASAPDTLGDPQLDRIKGELARLFDVDLDMAANIVSAMPIVILDGLDGHGAGVVRERLSFLRELGCTVVTTDVFQEDMPRINWPNLPPIARVEPPPNGADGEGPAPAPSAGLGCPNCGVQLTLGLAGEGRPAVHDPHDRAAVTQTAPARTPAAEPPLPEAQPAVDVGSSDSDLSDSDLSGSDLSGSDLSGGDLSGGPSLSPPPPSPAFPEEDDDWMDAPAPSGISASSPAPPPPRKSSGRFDDPALGRSSGAQRQTETSSLHVAFAEESGEHPVPEAEAQQAAPAPPPPAPEPESQLGAVADLEDSGDELDPVGSLLDSGEAPVGRAPSPPSNGELEEFRVSGDGSDIDILSESGSIDMLESRRARRIAESASSMGAYQPSGSGRADRAVDNGGGSGSGSFDSGDLAELLEDSDEDLPAPPPRGHDPLEDSGSDILDVDPPHRRSDESFDRAFDSDDLEDLLDDSGARPAAPPRSAPEPDDFSDLEVVDERPGRGRSSAELEPAASSPSNIDEVLDLFGPEDGEPLDDGDGLEPAPLDLSPPSAGGGKERGRKRGRSRDPFDEDQSDILEPLDPNEALDILQTQRQPKAPARSRRDEDPPGLEPLDPSEAYAILATDDDGKSRRKRKKKTRGVPFAASDEDVLLEDSGRRPAKAGGTDPFARARGREEPSSGRSRRRERDGGKSERKSSGRRRRAERTSGRNRRSSGPAKSAPKPAKAPAKARKSGGGPGDHGLVLSRISDPDKKETAAELIAEIKGCSLDDARRLTERTIIPVLKGVSKDEAQEHLDRFKRHKIAGRVTTRQRS